MHTRSLNLEFEFDLEILRKWSEFLDQVKADRVITQYNKVSLKCNCYRFVDHVENRAAILRHLQEKQTSAAGNRSIDECFWTTEANHHSFGSSYPVDWVTFFAYFERALINGNSHVIFLVNRSYLYSRYWTGTTILDSIKWNNYPPSPPKQWWRREGAKNAPFWHHWNGGRGGPDVPFILSKIVARNWGWCGESFQA